MYGDRYRIGDQNALYFLTLTVVDWVDVFTRKEHKIEIVDSLNYCVENKGLEIFAWCLMSNHLHLVARAKEKFRLSDILRDFKKFTSKRIVENIQIEPESRRDWMLYRFKFAGKFKRNIENYKFWKDGYHAILLDNPKIAQQKIDYVHLNPVRAMIVEEPYQYWFSSARDYAGDKGVVKVQLWD